MIFVYSIFQKLRNICWMLSVFQFSVRIPLDMSFLMMQIYSPTVIYDEFQRIEVSYTFVYCIFYERFYQITFSRKYTKLFVSVSLEHYKLQNILHSEKLANLSEDTVLLRSVTTVRMVKSLFKLEEVIFLRNYRWNLLKLENLRTIKGESTAKVHCDRRALSSIQFFPDLEELLFLLSGRMNATFSQQ